MKIKRNIDRKPLFNTMYYILLILLPVIGYIAGVTSQYMSRKYVKNTSYSKDSASQWEIVNKHGFYFNKKHDFFLKYPTNWNAKSVNMQYKGAVTLVQLNKVSNTAQNTVNTGNVRVTISKLSKTYPEEFAGLTRSEFYDLNNSAWQSRKNLSGGGGVPSKVYSIVNYGDNTFVKEETVWSSGQNEKTLLRTSYFIYFENKGLWEIQSEMNPNDPQLSQYKDHIVDIITSFTVI